MPAIKLKTPAKVNLILSLLKKRLDNYHELETFYQTISLYDVITVEYRESSSLNIRIKCDHPEVPTDSSNLAHVAAVKFMEAIQEKADIKIHIAKMIPVAAGLGGGSSDAACVLNALNKLNFYPLKEDIIKRIAQSIGADVSFFLKGGSALGSGIGDILEPTIEPDLTLVIVKPTQLSVSAGWAYERYDQLSIKPAPKRVFDLIEGIRDKDIEKISRHLFNSLEYAVLKDYPELRNIKEKLIKLGCHGALMSGSGPTFFGIAKDEAHAQELANAIRSDEYATWVAKTVQTASVIS